jgi:dihydropteroate synthase
VSFPRDPYTIPLPGRAPLQLGERTLVMGILNVTPDSFADGGHFASAHRAIDQALAMEAAGADIIDLGGESTRPGAAPVPADEELRRVLPVLEGLQGRLRVPVSIDTYKAAVADAALLRGAAIVNDISALQYDPALARVVVQYGAAVVLMHNRGRSRDMYQAATYHDAPREVAAELTSALGAAVAAGIDRERIVLDPGLGFAKRADHSYAVLANLPTLAAVGRPLLVGPSRKSFLQAALGERPASHRQWGTAAAVTTAVFMGAHIVRVHDVAEMVDVVRVADRVRAACRP